MIKTRVSLKYEHRFMEERTYTRKKIRESKEHNGVDPIILEIAETVNAKVKI